MSERSIKVRCSLVGWQCEVVTRVTNKNDESHQLTLLRIGDTCLQIRDFIFRTFPFDVFSRSPHHDWLKPFDDVTRWRVPKQKRSVNFLLIFCPHLKRSPTSFFLIIFLNWKKKQFCLSLKDKILILKKTKGDMFWRSK